jgi:hypothetical protein
VDDHAVPELVPPGEDRRAAEILRAAKAAGLGAALGLVLILLARRRRG